MTESLQQHDSSGTFRSEDGHGNFIGAKKNNIAIFLKSFFFFCVLTQHREGNFPGDSKQITYSELLSEVCKFANVLKDKGDIFVKL